MSANSRDVRSYNPTVQQLFELHEAALEISSELDLSRLLQRIVEVARTLTRSHYAALGIVGEDGLIEQFLTSGLSATEREAIGELPRGHGLLGVLIKEGRPIRIASIGADPRSVGFPANHPLMITLLGMPIIYRGQIVGDLYLTDKENGEMWSDEDEWLTSLLASHAAVAIGNAHLYRALEQERAEANNERQRLQVLLENLPEGVMVCDAEGTVTILNPVARQLFSWEVGHHFTDRPARIQYPDGSSYAQDELPLMRTLRDQVRIRGQHLVVADAETGRVRDIFASTAPLHDAEGRLTGAVGVYQDITALKEVERLKDEFFSMATHELRTPLTSITMSSGLLAELLAGRGGRVAELARLVAENAQRMRTLVDDLLDLSRLEHGRLVLHRREFDLGTVVAHVVDQVEPLAERKTQTLTVQVPAARRLVLADSSRIEQVLLNLLGNAVKYTPEGGAVRVSVSRRDGHAQVTVQDSGPGVAPDERDHIFERFYRTQQHEVDRSTGTGLGLPIARMLVELHGGRLWYEDAPGGGSCFCFTLPIR
jgi:PAS domain S-box-containing protein